MKVSEGRIGRVFVMRLEDGDVVPECTPIQKPSLAGYLQYLISLMHGLAKCSADAGFDLMSGWDQTTWMVAWKSRLAAG